MNRFFILCAFLIVLALDARRAQAQLFGERNLGSTIRSRSAARQLPGLSVSGRRFARGARRAENFVGTDRGETRQFVGRNAAGATPLVRSAVSGISINPSTNVNQPVQQSATGTMYLPRLVLAEEFQPDVEFVAEAEASLSIDLASRLTQMVGSSIEVSVVKRTATIRGVVASAKDRRRAEILASFEPGVSVVRNDLQVADGSEADSSGVPPEPNSSPR